jgi:sigma-B regulation protein RsbU (phosphoserine phosphatase)
MKPDTQYTAAPEIALQRGDLILLLTDGIDETSGPDGTLFGLERTLETVRSAQNRNAQQIVQALYEAARDFSKQAPQIDDITAIVIKAL